MNLAQLSVDETGADAAGFESDPFAVLEALDCLRVAVTLYDCCERLVYINQHFHYIFRAMPPAEVLIGRTFDEMIRLELDSGEIDPIAFRGSEDAFIAARRTQLTVGDFTPRDVPLADGRIIETKARPTSSGGWIMLWSDATQARHDYGRLQNAIELSADAFALWDKDDRLVLWNPGFAVLHGSAADADLKGLTFPDMIRSVFERGFVKFEGSLEAAIDKRMQAHRVQAGATTVLMASGQAYLVRERQTPDGGHATVYTDITDRHRAESAFTETSAALRATRRVLDTQANYLADLTSRLDKAEAGAAQAKTTFLRTMSHELKTPLNAIIGFSDLLQSASGQFSAEQVSEYAGLIHGAGGNLLRMLNQILDLTKIAAGRYALDTIAMPVRSLFDTVYDAFGEKAEDKAITLDIGDCPAELAVAGDEQALMTMIEQLVQNAVTFTQTGGTVRLSAERCGARVRIRIEDDGPGVAAEDMGRITQPFEQVGHDTASHSGGNGLGLPLVKALTELQDGTLRLESKLGDGFAATLDLPAA